MLTIRRSARWLFAAALLLSAVPAPAAEVDKLLPDDTETVLVVNVRQLLDAPLVKKYGLQPLQDWIKNSGELADVLTSLGFDPLKDLTTVTAASSSVGDQEKGLLIAHGKLDLAKFRAKADEVSKSHGDVVKVHKADDAVIYEVQPPGANTMFVALPNDSTLVASPTKDYVVDALAKASGKKAATVKKELQTLIEKADANQSVWLALPGTALTKGGLAGDDKAKKTFEKVEALTGGVTVGSGVKAQLVITAKNADGAKELTEEVNDGLNQAKGLIAVLAGNEKKLQPVADVLNALKTTTEGTTITIRGEVSEDAIDKAIKNP